MPKRGPFEMTLGGLLHGRMLLVSCPDQAKNAQGARRLGG
jgi:hypothetical protein